MDQSAQPEAVAASLQAAIPGILETRYLSVIGLTVLLWDHFLTFEQELRLIWPSGSNYAKWAFLYTRYLVPTILIINSHTISGISGEGLSSEFCKVWFAISFSSGIVSLSVGNSMIILKIWSLWDGKKDAISGTIIVFALNICGLVVFMTLVIRESLPFVFYDPIEHMCSLAIKPQWLKGVWALSSGFDAFVFAMVCLNALSRPRGSQTFLVKVLYRDGMFFFVAISALGWLNLVLAIVAPLSQTIIGIFLIWAVSVTLVSRMILNLREAGLKTDEIEGEAVADGRIHKTSLQDTNYSAKPEIELLPVNPKSSEDFDSL